MIIKLIQIVDSLGGIPSIHDGKEIPNLINIDNVERIVLGDGIRYICLVSGQTVRVKETADELLALLIKEDK